MRSPIKRRVVLYCPGYDAVADRRYYPLMVTELALLTARFGIEHEIGPVEAEARVPSVRWSMAAGNAEWRSRTSYEVMRWDDLIRRDLNRSWRKRAPLFLEMIRQSWRERFVIRLFRINWHFAALLIYPVVAFLGTLGAAIAAGFGVADLVALFVPLSPWLEALLTIVCAGAFARIANPWLRKAYVYHVLDDWIFHWQDSLGRRPDFDTRLGQFGDRLIAATRAAGVQEILVVGHSSGAIIAIETVARALMRDPELGRRGPKIALMTIGGRVPISALWSSARRLREAIARVAIEPALLWVEYQAPQDPFHAFGFDPVRDLKLDLGGHARIGPVIRSARLKERLLPETYRRLRWKFFRIHFEFLRTNERIGEYDYPMIVCGPVSLADRIRNPAQALIDTYGVPHGRTNAKQSALA
jgi:hypothetical protein